VTASPRHERTSGRPQSDDASLDDWVAGLVSRHGLGSEIPQCWREHGGLADELESLRAAEEAALTRGQLVPLQWFHQLRELVGWCRQRTPGRCAREECHHEEEAWYGG
jgi:hypothetical protein